MARLSDEIVSAGLFAAASIENGHLPTDAEINSAPVLSGWVVRPLGAGLSQLAGFVEGHPTIPDGFCSTSALLVLDPGRRWARTVSRLYALGEPLSDAIAR